MSLRAEAWAAATIANLGPGFDVLGLCLEGPRDTVVAELTDTGAVEIVEITGDGGRLPTAAAENCAGVAAQAVLARFGDYDMGARLWLHKGLPLGSGMGSSAASSVAAAVAVAALIDRQIPKAMLLDACRAGERLATGTPHPDNVAPALFGGLVACMPASAMAATVDERFGTGTPGDDSALEPVDVLRLPVPPGLYVAAVKPAFEVRTADARAVLPTHVPLADAVRNLAAMAGLVSAMATGDWAVLARSLSDHLVTPYRKGLIDGYDAVVAAAREAGAVGAGIAGSGSTVFALTDRREVALDVADAMVAAFRGAGHEATGLVSAVDPDGAQVELTQG